MNSFHLFIYFFSYSCFYSFFLWLLCLHYLRTTSISKELPLFHHCLSYRDFKPEIISNPQRFIVIISLKSRENILDFKLFAVTTTPFTMSLVSILHKNQDDGLPCTLADFLQRFRCFLRLGIIGCAVGNNRPLRSREWAIPGSEPALGVAVGAAVLESSGRFRGERAAARAARAARRVEPASAGERGQ